MSKKLPGKVAAITGGSSRIWLARLGLKAGHADFSREETRHESQNCHRRVPTVSPTHRHLAPPLTALRQILTISDLPVSCETPRVARSLATAVHLAR